MAGLPKKECDLFDALRDPEFDNFELQEIEAGGSSHLVICADHSQDGEDDPEAREILYVRATPEVLQVLGIEEQDEVDAENVRHVPEEVKPKRWGGGKKPTR